MSIINFKRKINTGIILAAGSGSRFHTNIPKQFFKLAGRFLIEYSIDTFEKCDLVDEIIVVIPSGYETKINELIEKNSWKKIRNIIFGGDSRAASTKAALNSLKENKTEVDNVIIHDAARPLLTSSVLVRCIEKLNTCQAVDVVVPAIDTIVEVTSSDEVKSIPDRNLLRSGQTPQGFHKQLIFEAYKKADLNNLDGITCDCSLLKREFPEIAIATVEGDNSNIKITNPIDLFIAEKLIQSHRTRISSKKEFKSLKNKVIVIFGGSYGIGSSIAEIAKKEDAFVEIASRSINNIDINQPELVNEFLSKIQEKYKKIDFIINTTGILIKKHIKDQTIEEVSTTISTNLTSAINLAKISYLYLKMSRGCLVNFSSSSYTRGRSSYATYSATKAAIVNFTQAIAEEWNSEGIRVICISPERTRTPMRVRNFGEEDKNTLLDPKNVAYTTLSAMTSSLSGIVVDARRN